jgi:hypothetical protein
MLALIAALLQITATPDSVSPPVGPVQPQPGDFTAIPNLAPTAPGGVAPSAAPAPAVPLPGQPHPELWRGAKAGMTRDQVIHLFPDARQAASSLVGHPRIPNAVIGGDAQLAVNEQVFGYPAVATYYFSQAVGLVEVVVSVRDLRLRHTLDNVSVARDIRTGLLAYYGKPKVCLDTDQRGLVRLDCRWTSRAVQVGLSYLEYGGLSPNLDVAIRAMPPKLHEHGATFARHGASS